MATKSGKIDRPNILVMLADDMGWGDVSYHGSAIRTPNIDRLVQTGIELDQHYVCPMCTPTRTCLMTGRHPGRFGRHATTPSNLPVLPDGYETIATSFRNAGYATGLFGKWHLGSDPKFCPNKYGFDTSYGSLAGGVDPYSHRYKSGPHSVTWHRNGELVEERGHVTDLITQEAVQWIESQSQPWFCYVPFTAVHTPIKAPQHWIDRYADTRYDLDPAKDRSFKTYAAYASHMDWAVGQLMETLARTCERQDTIVIFTSDNGAIPSDPLHDTDKYPGWQEEMPRLGSNLPLRGKKSQLYEGGIRTPSVISWQSHLRPGKMLHPIHATDWMPTLTGLIDYTPGSDPRWDGRDIWPLLTGDTAIPSERSLFWNFKGSSFGLRRGDWKLIYEAGQAPEETELFHLGRDPNETRNWAPENLGLVEDMMGEIGRQRKLDDTSRRPDVD
jgi:arylsulfatase A-like enzyme